VFVSHDRYFVDKLASKVIEVGGGGILLYPGGYEDFVDWKKHAAALPAPASPRQAESAAEKTGLPPVSRPSKPASPKPAVSKPSKPASPPAPPPRDPMAPRLRPKDARPERAVIEREAKKRKARLAELEQRIAEKEKAVKELEAQMASPGFYDDRARAERAAADHKSLMWEVGDLMSQWEMLAEADANA
jgi:ATP-binding cassette subfamily F protein 3